MIGLAWRNILRAAYPNGNLSFKIAWGASQGGTAINAVLPAQILRPEEVGPVYRGFKFAALIFLVAITTGLRRMELLNLRWRAVHLTDPDGPYVHVEKSKSKAGIRDVALPPAVADALFEHRGVSAYDGDDDFVFAHPEKGSGVRAQWYAERFREALEAAGMGDEEIRPFHDLRHSAVTALALEARNAFTLQHVAGHANIATTQAYVRLAGRRFPDEAAALERRYGLALAGDK